jgi:hypothetical protein
MFRQFLAYIHLAGAWAEAGAAIAAVFFLP